jgi:hypothetical protein
MIKLFNLDRLPLLIVMALQAIYPKPPFVFVLMARNAGRRNAEQRPVQIFNLDGRALRGRHFVG